MSIIQITLTSGIVFISLYMYIKIRNSVYDTVLIFLFLFVGILLVLFPELTNNLAKFFGVARGVHLLIYLGFLFLFFLILKLYSRTKKIEQKLTELIRIISLEKAENLSNKSF